VVRLEACRPSAVASLFQAARGRSPQAMPSAMSSNIAVPVQQVVRRRKRSEAITEATTSTSGSRPAWKACRPVLSNAVAGSLSHWPVSTQHHHRGACWQLNHCVGSKSATEAGHWRAFARRCLPRRPQQLCRPQDGLVGPRPGRRHRSVQAHTNRASAANWRDCPMPDRRGNGVAAPTVWPST